MIKNAELLFNQKSNLGLDFNLSRESIMLFLTDTLKIITPGMIAHHFKNSADLSIFIERHLEDLKRFLKVIGPDGQIEFYLSRYEHDLPFLSQMVLKDANAILDGDPAAKSLSEVLLCYPGFFAISAHRIAHYFQMLNIPILPRMISEIAHEKTGIDIHPGAKIGESFFIDHGTGIVIGESAIIGNHVKIYQGVTLGALSVDKNMALIKRHPTIEDHCVIYSHATILGGSTVIGKHSIIGGNVWITKSIAPNSIVYHKSEVKLDTKSISTIEELTYEI